MRKLTAFFLMLMLTLALCACSASDTVYTIEVNSTVFTVDSKNRTISDGMYAYAYAFSGDASSYDISIQYPNGAEFYWHQSGTIGHGGWSDNYDDSLYADGNTLCRVITAKAPKSAKPEKTFAAILLLAAGVFNIVSPRAAWVLEFGWRYRNAEPSDAALVANRIGGIVAALAGIILIFV